MKLSRRKKSTQEATQACATIGAVKISQISPGSQAGGGRQCEIRKNYPKPAPKKLGKRVLCHNRAARLFRLAPALNEGVGRTKQKRNIPKLRPKSSENVKNKPIRKPPTPQTPPKRKTIERSGDAKLSYPRLRLEIHLRYVGPPRKRAG